MHTILTIVAAIAWLAPFTAMTVNAVHNIRKEQQ